jgi:hypothetical protein
MSKGRNTKKGIRKRKVNKTHKKINETSKQKAGRVLRAIGRFKTATHKHKNHNLHRLGKQIRVITGYSI